MGVGDDQRAQDGVHDGVEGAGGERSNGEGNEADGDQSVVDVSSSVSLGWTPRSARKRVERRTVFSCAMVWYEPLKSPVVAAVGGVGFGDGGRVVHCWKGQFQDSERGWFAIQPDIARDKADNSECLDRWTASDFMLKAAGDDRFGERKADITYWYPRRSLQAKHVSKCSLIMTRLFAPLAICG